MNGSTPIDDQLLAKYVAGEADAAERTAVEQWTALARANALELERMRSLWSWSADGTAAPEPDVDAAWNKLEQRIGNADAGRRVIPMRTGNVRRWIAAEELDGADPGDVLVTHGSQQALRLLVDALVDPGDVVVVERTSYVGMLQALAPSGARLVDVGSDEHGMVTDELELLLRDGLRPKLAYLAPTFQNPTGMLGNARVQTSSPFCSRTGRPESSNTSTAIPRPRHWISPRHTGSVGLPITNAEQISVPPDMEESCASDRMDRYTKS